MKNILYRIWNCSPAQILNILRNEINPPKYVPKFKIDPKELKRLQNMPRYVEGETTLMGKKVNFIDADSYLAMCDEIFVRNNYQFTSRKESPLIIDCGSNIGLSVFFFKLLYPKSKIIAFEPDRKAFLALEKILKILGLRMSNLIIRLFGLLMEKLIFLLKEVGVAKLVQMVAIIILLPWNQ